MIYFVENTINNHIKIGYTKDIKARLYQLSRENKDELKLLKCIRGGIKLEKQLHADFSDARVAGEWFKNTPELTLYIARQTPLEDFTREVNYLEKQIGNDVRFLRLNKNLSQEELADLANVSLSAVKHIEIGSGARVQSLVSVLAVLGKTDWIRSLSPVVSINPLNMVGNKARQRARRNRNE